MSQENFTADPQDVQNNKVMAILAYFLFLIPLFAAKDSPFARFHTNQGCVLFISAVAFNILTWILVFISPFLGFVSLLGIVFFVLFIIGIVNAANGQMKELPLIGKFRIIK